jgi:Ca2+-binding RTX toxin-like protein
MALTTASMLTTTSTVTTTEAFTTSIDTAALTRVVGTFEPVPTAGLLIEGTNYVDTLYGSNADDDIYGLAGNDRLYGQNGNDNLFGGIGDDMLNGGWGADRLDGGTGNDTASYSGSTAVTVDLGQGLGFGGQAAGDTYTSIENVQGSAYADILIGNSGSNSLWGGAGKDQLNGGVGDDWIDGGTGNDILTGDLAGYLGRDTFVLRPTDGADTIVDFQKGWDKIALSGFDDTDFGPSNVLTTGHLDRDGGLHIDTLGRQGVNLLYLTDTNQLLSFDSLIGINGNWDVKGEKLIATVNVDLTASDFIFI